MDSLDKGVDRRSIPDFTQPGPFKAVRLPNLEHTCASCFPKCVGDRCLLRIFVTYPGGRTASTIKPPYPLAIISGGFLVKGEMYQSYAQRLASWGYVAIVYDKVESILDALDDVISAAFVREIIDYCHMDPLLNQLVIPDQVYLIGHSRGGKVSVLAAEDDDRVVGLCLIDPVDNTVYAPISPGFPSAVAAMQSGSRSIPIVVIGGGQSVDCAPAESNYTRFYDAAKSVALEVVLNEAGHFQFLDDQNTLQKSVCVQGRITDEAVRYSTQSVMIAWGEALFREKMLTRVQIGSLPVSPMDSIKLTLEKISKEKKVALESKIKNYSMLRMGRQVRSSLFKW